MTVTSTGAQLLEGIKLEHSGKVRNMYGINGEYLLMYATDRISVFDVCLKSHIPEKGPVLTALCHHSFKMLETALNIKTHLIAAGAGIDDYLDQYPHLKGNPHLQARAMVVRRLEMVPREFIARTCITGSAWKEYLENNGVVCGHNLPAGLQEGDELPEIIATPSTKAKEGPDLALNQADVQKEYPEETALVLQICDFWSRHCRTRSGLVLADMKVEFGRCKRGTVILGDEVGTPDACRYWSEPDWNASRSQVRRTAPAPLDKQLVRNWAKSETVTPELQMPEWLISETTKVYRNLFMFRTRTNLEEYQKNVMGIKASK